MKRPPCWAAFAILYTFNLGAAPPNDAGPERSKRHKCYRERGDDPLNRFM